MFKMFLKPYKKKVRIDSFHFVLHYKVSLSIFLVASLIITIYQFVGRPIQCEKVKDVPNEVVNNYCWMNLQIFKQYKRVVPHPGLSFDEPEYIFHPSCYKWVFLILFLQAFSFYVPKLIWTAIENKKVESLIQNNLNVPAPDKDEKEIALGRVAEYWTSCRGAHSGLALTYLFCEALNLVNLLGQVFFIGFFLGIEFKTLGFDVLYFELMPSEERENPIKNVFPKILICTFMELAPSATINRHTTLCTLPINNINEAIYIIIWFWLVCLAVISTLFLVYLIVISLLPPCRVKITTSRVLMPVLNSDIVFAVHSEKLNWFQNLGDWIILDFLFQNLDKSTNAEIIRRIKRSSIQKTTGSSENQPLMSISSDPVCEPPNFQMNSIEPNPNIIQVTSF